MNNYGISLQCFSKLPIQNWSQDGDIGNGHNIINGDINEFCLTRDKQKLLKRPGNNGNTSQPSVGSELNTPYEKQFLGTSSPDSLLNTVWLKIRYILV